MPIVSDTFGLTFAPERWGFCEKFHHFMGPPFLENRELRKETATITSHLRRYDHVANLANRVMATLKEDIAELDATGMTHAIRFKEFALLAEMMYCELYSCLDGLRRSIFGGYGKVRGVQNDSTEKLLKRANERKYGPEFPEAIWSMLDEAWTTWFPGIRIIRTEVTHGEVGSCHLDKESKTVTYFQHGVRRGSGVLIVKDVVSDLNSLRGKITTLIDEVFSQWYQQLEYTERTIPCGIWRGRFYQRLVAAEPVLTFATGQCESVNWFRNDTEYACPLRESCGAYARREQHVREIAYRKWIERGSPLWEADLDWAQAEEELSQAYFSKYADANPARAPEQEETQIQNNT
jgi:Protein of unknown function (DUF2934)